MRRSILHALCAAAATALASACSDAGGPGPSGDSQLSFNLATQPLAAGVSAGIALAAPESYTRAVSLSLLAALMISISAILQTTV